MPMNRVFQVTLLALAAGIALNRLVMKTGEAQCHSKDHAARQVVLPGHRPLAMPAVVGRGPAAESDREQIARGKELFEREWLPGDRRSYAGDGLGPLFNARSCAACHFLGGTGVAGPHHTNVTIASVFLKQKP